MIFDRLRFELMLFLKLFIEFYILQKTLLKLKNYFTFKYFDMKKSVHSPSVDDRNPGVKRSAALNRLLLIVCEKMGENAQIPGR